MAISNPRNGYFYHGVQIVNTTFHNGTWLEGEEFSYPNNAYTRRAYALCQDGKLRVCVCCCSDNYSSVPARMTVDEKRVKGFLSIEDETLHFTEIGVL